MVSRFRSLAVVVLTLLSALALGVVCTLTASLTAGLKTVTAQVLLRDGESYFMGGSGLPNPSDAYVADLFDKYVSVVQNGAYADFGAHAFNTPEGLYPMTGVKDLTLDVSVARGVQAMEGSSSTIMGSLANGDDVTVLGYSQSAILSSLFMQDMHDQGVSPDQLAFVLLGNPMNPNGGLLERFAGLTLPSVGLTFYGATPSDLYTTDVFTLEYDGFADFPRYPLNLLADLNAFAGIYYVHGTYPALTPDEIAGAIPLDTTGGLTNYWMIETPNLPLLEPLRALPLIGNPLADLVQPDLTYLINMGYGDPLYGWSTAPADVATPFGLFPGLDAFAKLPPLLLSGAQEGINDFIGDFTGTGPNPVSLSLAALLPALGGSGGAAFALPDLTDIVNTLSGMASSAYATLLPTADIVNAMFTSLPAYDLSLFVDALQAGDLIGAIGDPLAATTGILTMAAGFEFLVLTDAASAIMADLSSLIPF